MKFAVKGTLGTVGILGNHDYGLDWLELEVADTITTILENAGIAVLRNQQKEMNGLNIIGMDDYWGMNFNPNKIMSKYNDKKANIVLCHNPDVCDLNVWHNYKGWILSGHTHGGQVKPPFLKPPILPVKNRRYSAGKIDLNDGRTLYINRALGNLLQIRFNVRPEITIFKLSKA
jgi:predicted MPP superfamily phosphohydrolase